MPEPPFDPALIAEFTSELELIGFVRIMRREHIAAPLGMGFGSSRFSSPDNAFKVLYAARDLATAIAEAIVRDRFEAVPPHERKLHISEVRDHAIAEIATERRLRLLDLRVGALFRLGFDTDAAGARAHASGQALSAKVHAGTTLDGIVYPSRLVRETCVVVYERAVVPALRAGEAFGLERAVALDAAFRALSVCLDRP